MEALKNLLAILAGVVGVLTAILTLYAKYLDIKKEAASKTDHTEPAPPVVTPPPPIPTFQPEPIPPVAHVAEPVEPASWYTPPAARYVAPAPEPRGYDPLAIERVKTMVRGPAIAMIVLGSISLFFNLVVAAYGFVDNFVTPISEESRARQAATESRTREASLAAFNLGNQGVPPEMVGSSNDGSEKVTAAVTMFLLLGLSVPCLVTIWGGIGMLRLQGYWVSVAGSFAIMFGASITCCMTGVPVGAWSLSVLYRPEVKTTFR